MQSDRKSLSLAWFLLLILTLIWGSSFLLIKKGLVLLTSGELGALRMFSAAIVLIPIAIKHLKSFTKQQYFFLFIVGFVGSFLPAFLFAEAETELDSAMAGILNALTPLFVVIIGNLFFSQSITPKSTIGILIGFAGTVVLMLSGFERDQLVINYFVLYIVLATIFYGTNVNIIKYKLHGIKAIPLTSMAMAMTLPFSIVYLFHNMAFVDKLSWQPEVMISLGYVVVLGMIGTAFAMVIFNKLVQISSPIFASSVTYLIPIVAVVLGLLDNEVLHLQHYVGMTIVLLGVYITNRK
ncbi:MAG: DMT family transporter [Bacteroidota bacterium]